MSANIRKLSSNTTGKDYVIGDLHGCYSLLEQLLREVAFDHNKDRLFSVGDLIDRGPDSLRCLQLLAEPWFYAVQGNHENMMANFFLPYLQRGFIEKLVDFSNIGFLTSGGEWVEDYFLPEEECMTDEFNQALLSLLDMPLMFVVGESEKRFHIIHAELTKSKHEYSDQMVWLDSDIDQWLAAGEIPIDIEDQFYWGRTLMRYQHAEVDMAKIQTGLSTVFCGHTYAPKLRQVLSHLCVDTGAFKTFDNHNVPYGLTLFDVNEACWYSAAYLRHNIIKGNYPLTV